MNKTCEDYSDISPNGLLHSLIEAREIVINYGIRGISALGIILNVLSLILIMRRQLTHNFYDFLRCRCICNLVVCIVGLGYTRAVFSECLENYRLIVFQWTGNTLFRTALLASSFSDNLVIINRYVILCNKKRSILNKMSKKVNLAICYLFPIACTIPFTGSAVKIVLLPDSSGQGYWTLSDFGNTSFFKVYSILILLLETAIPIVTLCVFNTLCLVKFNSLMKKKSEIISASDEKIKKSKTRFFKLIIIITTMSILSHIPDSVTAIFKRAKFFYQFTLSDEIDAAIDLAKQIFTLFVLAAHSLDVVFYFLYDKQIKIELFKIFKKN